MAVVLAQHICFPDTNAKHHIPVENQMLQNIKKSANRKYQSLKNNMHYKYEDTVGFQLATLQMQRQFRKNNKKTYKRKKKGEVSIIQAIKR